VTKKSLDAIIVSVARTFKWSPKALMEMYVDDFDYQGLIFWYNDVKEQNDKLKK